MSVCAHGARSGPPGRAGRIVRPARSRVSATVGGVRNAIPVDHPPRAAAPAPPEALLATRAAT
jgi:hypothetical protein